MQSDHCIYNVFLHEVKTFFHSCKNIFVGYKCTVTPKSQRSLVVTAIAVAAVVCAWFSLVVLTPTFGTVIRYDNQQPLLRVALASANTPREAADDVLRLSRLHFDNCHGLDGVYWPEPSLLEEHTDCWLVAFTRKVPVFRFLGHEEIVRHADETMFLSITKSNYVARFGKWCR